MATIGFFSKISLIITTSFIIGTIVLHIGLCFFLIFQKDSFKNDTTGETLQKVNSPCFVTLFRISSLLTIVFLMIPGQFTLIYTMIAILSFTFLTDFLDGFLARHLNQKTRIGRILDSVSDYILLSTISGIYCWYGLIPLWLLIMVFIRLGLQAIGMFIFLIKRNPVEPNSTIGGKIAIATLMIGFVLELCIEYFQTSWTEWGVLDTIIEIIVGIILFLSCFEKIRIFNTHKNINKEESLPKNTNS